MNFNDINTPNELLDYMINNITYGFLGTNGKRYDNPDSEEWNDWYDQSFIQSGEEVLKSKTGICWDQVELERLWFSKHNYEFVTVFIWFSVDYVNSYPTHSFLLYKDNNKWNWFENAFFDCTGIHEYNSKEDAIKSVKDKFMYNALINGWAKPEDEKYIMTREYNKPKDDLNVQDYLNHVTGCIDS